MTKGLVIGLSKGSSGIRDGLKLLACLSLDVSGAAVIGKAIAAPILSSSIHKDLGAQSQALGNLLLFTPITLSS